MSDFKDSTLSYTSSEDLEQAIFLLAIIKGTTRLTEEQKVPILKEILAIIHSYSQPNEQHSIASSHLLAENKRGDLEESL